MRKEKKKRTAGKAVIATVASMSLLLSIAAALEVYNLNFLKSTSFFPGDEIISSEKSNVVSLSQNAAGSLEDSSGMSMSFGFATQLDHDVEMPVETVDDIMVYPNPVKPGSGGEFDSNYLNIAGLKGGEEISIYNITGERVIQLENDSNSEEVQWNLKNESGKNVASGVYIYIIIDEEKDSTSGRVGLVR